MRSKPSEQGKRLPFTGLWRGCGTSGVRQRETRQPSQNGDPACLGRPSCATDVTQTALLSTKAQVEGLRGPAARITDKGEVRSS